MNPNSQTVVVPQEPTESMLWAAAKASKDCGMAYTVLQIRDIYRGMLAAAPKSDGPDSVAQQAIREHNEGCEASCKAQRPNERESGGCGYQKHDGSKIYSRRCPNCPLDWTIDLPASEAGAEPQATWSPWILCEERLPEVGSRVLVILRVLWSVETAKFREDERGKFWRIGGHRTTLESAKWWMPLPPKPMLHIDTPDATSCSPGDTNG